MTGYPRDGAPGGLKICHQGYQKSKRNLEEEEEEEERRRGGKTVMAGRWRGGETPSLTHAHNHPWSKERGKGWV